METLLVQKKKLELSKGNEDDAKEKDEKSNQAGPQSRLFPFLLIHPIRKDQKDRNVA